MCTTKVAIGSKAHGLPDMPDTPVKHCAIAFVPELQAMAGTIAE